MLNLTAVVPVKSYLSRKQERSNEPAEVFPNQCQIDALAQCAIDSLHAVLGVSMIQSLATWQNTAIKLHQSLGVLVCLRLINRLFIQTPALPSALSAVQHFAAKATQVVLYVLMIALPIAGWLIRNAAGLPASFLACFSCRCWSARGLSHTACTVSCMAFIQQ